MKMVQVLPLIVALGKKEGLTVDEMGLIDTFTRLYLTALSGEKNIETQEQFLQLAEDNLEAIINMAMSFKYIKYPDSEMNREEFIMHTTRILISKFGEEAVRTVTRIWVED